MTWLSAKHIAAPVLNKVNLDNCPVEIASRSISKYAKNEERMPTSQNKYPLCTLRYYLTCHVTKNTPA